MVLRNAQTATIGLRLNTSTGITSNRWKWLLFAGSAIESADKQSRIRLTQYANTLPDQSNAAQNGSINY